jgi:asparagine synthase (glutamine-hydrolysing)
MTAIAGIWGYNHPCDIAGDCARMLAAQGIFGRDGEGKWVGPEVAVGRRLTKILPEDVYDTQPLKTVKSSLVLVADLRLDNRDELATQLGIAAPHASKMCDAALLLSAFERWDEDCCVHLVGDYAFAIWDERAQRLVLARDIIGARPLHYHRGSGFFAFASIPKGLHALPYVPYCSDEERIAEFLALLPQYGSRSFFKDIERVEPGHVVTVTKNTVKVRRYWNWQRRTLSFSSADDYVQGLRHYLELAVQSQLRGVGESVATCLSAGLDSTAVTTTAARLMHPSGGKVLAITAAPRLGYHLPAPKRRLGDESLLAAQTAAIHPNIRHVVVRSDGRTPLDSLDQNFFLIEGPQLNLCLSEWGLAIYDELRAQNQRVLLTAGMGNLTLSYTGNEHFPELIRSGQWLKWMHAVNAAARAGHWRLRGALLGSFAPWFPPALWQTLCRAYYGASFDILRYSAIHPRRLAELGLQERARAHGLDFTYRPWKDGVAMRLWALNRTDIGNGRKATLGGWGIDVRDPTADRRLIEFCLSVPTEQFFRNGAPRALARAALADRVPAEVLNERRRGLQAVDWHEGMTAARSQILEEIARLEQNGPAVRALDLPRMRRLAENWPAQRWHREDIIEQYRLALLRGISVGHFLRRASGGNV